MDTQAVAAQLEAACTKLGLDGATARRVVQEAFLPEWTALATEKDQLQEERDQMAAIQQEVQRLVEAPTPQKIVHDLRNILNELGLLRAIAGADDEAK